MTKFTINWKVYPLHFKPLKNWYDNIKYFKEDCFSQILLRDTQKEKSLITTFKSAFWKLHYDYVIYTFRNLRNTGLEPKVIWVCSGNPIIRPPSGLSTWWPSRPTSKASSPPLGSLPVAADKEGKEQTQIGWEVNCSPLGPHITPQIHQVSKNHFWINWWILFLSES